MAEFAANNNDFIFTRLSPFVSSKDLYPYMSFNVDDFSDTTTCKQINKKKAIDISKAMQSIWKYAQESLVKLQISQLN